MHAVFDELLQLLAIPADVTESVAGALGQWVDSYGAGKGGAIMRLKMDRGKLSGKLESAQEKYLLGSGVDEGVYKRVTGALRADIAAIDEQLREAQAGSEKLRLLVDRLLPQLADVSGLFDRFGLHQKRLFLSIVFPKGLYWDGETCRTPEVLELFTYNLLVISKKKLLYKEQLSVELPSTGYGGAGGSLVEHLTRLWECVAG